MHNTFFDLVWAIIWFVISAVTLGCYFMSEAPLGMIIFLIVIVIFWTTNILIIATKLDRKINKGD